MSKTTHKRRRAERAGRRAEMWAALILRLKGYRILATRWSHSGAEIDIIAENRKRRIFAEVKYRASADEALDSITWHQEKAITDAAEAHAYQVPLAPHKEMRFDVFACAPGRWPRHIPNAWHG